MPRDTLDLTLDQVCYLLFTHHQQLEGFERIAGVPDRIESGEPLPTGCEPISTRPFNSIERRLQGLRPIRCGSKGSVERWIAA